jgi:hypothetical protein
MAPLPTESRIFADRYRRDLKRREAVLAERIAPGTKTWSDALAALFERIDRAGSPIKRASLIQRLTEYLNDSIPDGAHFLLDHGGGQRSAGLMFATLSAGEHPLVGVNEEGVNIVQHMVLSRRNGTITASSGADLAFISKHAIGRLHERGHNLSDMKATCVLACVGILGVLTRSSVKHIDSGLALHYDDTLIVGSLKHALQQMEGGGERRYNGTFFDVRTALPADEVRSREMLEQGAYATRAVASWLDDRGVSKALTQKLADTIPFLPRREDYTSLTATRSNP